MPRRNASGTFVWGPVFVDSLELGRDEESRIWVCHAKTHRGLRERRRSKIGAWTKRQELGAPTRSSMELFATPECPPFTSTRPGIGPRDTLRAFPAPYLLEVRECLNSIAPLMDGRRADRWLSPATPHPLQSTGTSEESDMRRMEGATLQTENSTTSRLEH